MTEKYALIIGNTEYIDPGLAQLIAPGKDVEDFAHVLKDHDLCSFDDVKVLLNQVSSSIIEAIDEFFDQKKSDDLLVLYFSGHGVRDELGSLYLASKNTIRTRLRSTAIKSDYIREAMDQSRSKRQVVILDCCNSGAFPQGTKAEVGGVMGMAKALQGYGRFVLTASDATQFAWEGNQVIGETDNSLFTHFLVKGLEGEADKDGDGKISVDELYDFAFDQISKITPKQTPTKSTSKQEGEIILRQITRIEDIKPMPLPNDLISEIEDTRPYVREAAVYKLEKILKGKNIGMARSAIAALEKIIIDENTTPRVAKTATQALESFRQAEKKDEKAEVERIAKTKIKADFLSRPKQPIAEKTDTKHKEKEKTGQRVSSKVEAGVVTGEKIESISINREKLNEGARNKTAVKKTNRFNSLFLPIGITGVVIILACISGGAAIKFLSNVLAIPQPSLTPSNTVSPTLTTFPTPKLIPSATNQVIVPVTASCSELLTPENDGEVVAFGKLIFTWEAVPNAASYILEMTMPNGSTASFKTKETKITRYAESTPSGGKYQWQITAYNTSNELICATDLFNYTKPEYVVIPRDGPESGPGAGPTCVPPTGCSFGYDPNTCTCL